MRSWTSSTLVSVLVYHNHNSVCHFQDPEGTEVHPGADDAGLAGKFWHLVSGLKIVSTHVPISYFYVISDLRSSVVPLFVITVSLDTSPDDGLCFINATSHYGWKRSHGWPEAISEYMHIFCLNPLEIDEMI